jgi:hypothetical protein
LRIHRTLLAATSGKQVIIERGIKIYKGVGFWGGPVALPKPLLFPESL